MDLGTGWQRGDNIRDPLNSVRQDMGSEANISQPYARGFGVGFGVGFGIGLPST